MNENQESLKSFYGYKETFTKAAQWLPVSKELTWIHTSNPYNDIEDDDHEQQRARDEVVHYSPREQNGNDLSQADYTAFAEGLAALSAVASQDQYNLTQTSTIMDQTQMQNHQSGSSPQQLDFILNSDARMPAGEHQVDPQLHMLEAGAAQLHSYVRAQFSPPHRDAQP